ncbi:MAG: hypothetical protein ABGX16_01865 [Pirellulales bacterium]
MIRVAFGVFVLTLFAHTLVAEDLSKNPFSVRNVVPPLDDEDDPRTSFHREPDSLPIRVGPFIEHRRGWVPQADRQPVITAVEIDGEFVQTQTNEGKTYQLGHEQRWKLVDSETPMPRHTQKHQIKLDPGDRHNVVRIGDTDWIATNHGLFRQTTAEKKAIRYESYGTNGPLATEIRDVAADSTGRLWVATPLGLSVREVDGEWRAIRGREGLPYEDLTAIAIDPADQLWIGTTRGLIHYRPNAKGRQWFYRAGERYLPDDHVFDVAMGDNGLTIYTATQGGLGRLDLVTTTLLEKAETIERVLNQRHRRLGLVAETVLNDAYQPSAGGIISDHDNDGLWTAYHVAAMSLAFAVTGDEAAKESARKSMHSLYMLQDVSGTPGLVARSVHTLEDAKNVGKDKDPQWRLSPDGTMYWKSDTSADEIDGHYLAFYAYWEHVAQHDEEERELCLEHIRALTDYIVENDYTLIDWDGERTYWGFWSPELLNNHSEHFLENGLNSLQLLSFLKTAYHATDDEKYQQHYESLIQEHGYLDNVLMEKKVFPDSNNHSDNQLGYVAWYPILQTEQDPAIRNVLHKAVRRHYRCLSLDRSSFFYFVTATIDPDYVDLEAAITNLKRIPTDRRQWQMLNSHRADIVFNPRIDRFGKSQLMRVLPADERNFNRWNENVYLPDSGGSGRGEDDGASYLLPYWMARHHGFVADIE